MRRLLALGFVALLACGRGDEPPAPPAAAEPAADAAAPAVGSPNARPDLVALLREDRDAPRHPADGAGRAWLEDGPARIAAGGVGSWSVVFEAGPEGVAEGGAVYLLASPFWGWSPPQVTARDAPGFTEVATEAAGVELQPEVVDAQLLRIGIAGRALAPGERVRMRYGAGPLGARADRFAERGARLWIAVDGDGDGVRAFLPESPTIDVVAGPGEMLVLTLDSRVRPGGEVRLHVAVLDAAGNAGVTAGGEVVLDSLPEGLRGPSRIALGEGGTGLARYTAERPGVYRLRARGPGDLRAQSNPLVVGERAAPLLWADLHGHSAVSDGTGTPEDYFRYARDVAGLDVAALTDHDHWGVRFLDQTPALWETIRAATAAAYAPGEFVTLLGFEWTNWVYGHRHVLYFDDAGPVISSLDEATDEPRELWDRLRGRKALTFAHHSAGDPVATDWSIPPDPELEPVTEVASVHGSSEALDAPRLIHGAIPGNTVRDALDRGYRLGFVGSGDSHDGHPGLAQLASGTGGLAAIVAEARTREAVLAALRARRTYATNGPRIVLRADVDGLPMGSLLAAGDAERELRISIAAVGPLERLDLIRNGQLVDQLALEGRLEAQLVRPLEPLAPGDYFYVRVVQQDGGAAWTSPWFAE